MRCSSSACRPSSLPSGLLTSTITGVRPFSRRYIVTFVQSRPAKPWTHGSVVVDLEHAWEAGVRRTAIVLELRAFKFPPNTRLPPTSTPETCKLHRNKDIYDDNSGLELLGVHPVLPSHCSNTCTFRLSCLAIRRQRHNHERSNIYSANISRY